MFGKKSVRDEMLIELSFRFKGGFFEKSEFLNKKKRDAIWLKTNYIANDGKHIINPDTLEVHPDLDVLLDKFDARLEPINKYDFLIYIQT